MRYLFLILFISCSSPIKFKKGDCFIKEKEKFKDELNRDRIKNVEYIVLKVNEKEQFYLSASNKPSLEKIPFNIRGVKKSKCEALFKK